jgi:sporulation protein YlmC with PRC-barrel domain
MHLELGAQVRTSDGHDIGEIEKLIVEPESGEVKAAVVRHGTLLPEDFEIPISAFAPGSGDEVLVDYTADQVKALPRFIPDNYRQPLPDYRSPFGYPPGGLLWPGADYSASGLDYARGTGETPSTDYDQIRSNYDDTTAVIEEGSDVMSRDGEKVGEVHSISVDPATGRPTRFVVRKGFLFTEDLELPLALVDSVGDDAVYLNVGKDDVKNAARPVETNYPKTVL